MGGPEMAPHTPQRSSRPGGAVARLDSPQRDRGRRRSRRAPLIPAGAVDDFAEGLTVGEAAEVLDPEGGHGVVAVGM
jgi:hypothetical protein